MHWTFKLINDLLQGCFAVHSKPLWSSDTVCNMTMKEQTLPAGTSDVLKGAPGEAVSAAALEAVDVMLMSYRGEAFSAGQPIQTMLHSHIRRRAG